MLAAVNDPTPRVLRPPYRNIHAAVFTTGDHLGVAAGIAGMALRGSRRGVADIQGTRGIPIIGSIRATGGSAEALMPRRARRSGRKRDAPTTCGRHGLSMGAHGPSRAPMMSRNVPSESPSSAQRSGFDSRRLHHFPLEAQAPAWPGTTRGPNFAPGRLGRVLTDRRRRPG